MPTFEKYLEKRIFARLISYITSIIEADGIMNNGRNFASVGYLGINNILVFC